MVTEPYREWYIQSQDTQLKKILNNDNINYVDDVKFYENIKLKILNAAIKLTRVFVVFSKKNSTFLTNIS